MNFYEWNMVFQVVKVLGNGKLEKIVFVTFWNDKRIIMLIKFINKTLKNRQTLDWIILQPTTLKKVFYASNYRIAKLKIEIMFVPNLNIKKKFTLQIQLQNWKQLNQLSLNKSSENKKAKNYSN